MAKKNYPFPETEIGSNFSSGISTHVDWEPRTNIIQTGDILTIEVELPGVNQGDVSIQLKNDTHLIIRGTKHQPRLNQAAEATATYFLFEREFGSFYKRIVVDFSMDEKTVQSSMQNGVLTVKISRKKAEEVSVQIK